VKIAYGKRREVEEVHSLNMEERSKIYQHHDELKAAGRVSKMLEIINFNVSSPDEELGFLVVDVPFKHEQWVPCAQERKRNKKCDTKHMLEDTRNVWDSLKDYEVLYPHGVDAWEAGQ
jgi:hypothetical protein